MLVSIVQQSESAIHTHVSSQKECSYLPVGRNIASWESQSIACWVHGLGFSMVQDKPQTQPTPVQTPQIQWFYRRTWVCVHLLLKNSKVPGNVHWKFRTGGRVLKILSNFQLPANMCSSYQVRLKPHWRIQMCPSWLRKLLSPDSWRCYRTSMLKLICQPPSSPTEPRLAGPSHEV